MYKSVSYYDKVADNYLVESDKTFSKAIISEAINAKVKYDLGKAVDESKFDIFLSHSYLDKKTVYGIYKDFESLGYNVYVDWIVDLELDRSEITKETAQKIRTRMTQSKCLIYATSSNTSSSKWMPWELGFMDGFNKSKVAVFPLKKENEKDSDIELPKYLELYYTCSKEAIEKTSREILWVNEGKNYVKFDKWLNEGKKPYKH